MPLHLIRSWILSFIIVALVFPCPAVASIEVFNEFSLDLPNRWDWAGQATAEAVNQNARERFGGSDKAPQYDYVFTGPEGAYMLVQIVRSNPPSQRELERAAQWRPQNSSVSDKGLSLIDNIAFNVPTYDPARQVIWLRASLQITEDRKQEIFSGIVPTSEGTIRFNAYTSENPKDLHVLDVANGLERIVSSVQLNPDLVWQPPTRNSLMVGAMDKFIGGIGSALIFVAALFVFRRLKRRKV